MDYSLKIIRRRIGEFFCLIKTLAPALSFKKFSVEFFF